MGIYDRDYVRSERRPSFSGGSGWDVVAWIIVVNVAVYVIELAWTRPQLQGEFGVAEVSVLLDWFALQPDKVLHGQIWRLLTYDFLHAEESVWHIAINMYVLFLCGRRLLGVLGEREFLLFYLSAGVLSGGLFAVWELARGHDLSVVGASGSVMAVMLLYALYWPRDIWLIFGVIPVPVMVIVGLGAVLDLHPVLYAMGHSGRTDHIAHVVHLGGMLFGLVYYLRRWRIEPWVPNLDGSAIRKWFRPRPRLRVHHPTDDAAPIDLGELQQRVDTLLEKIHNEGEQSLSAADRDVLNTASRILRKRRNA